MSYAEIYKDFPELEIDDEILSSGCSASVEGFTDNGTLVSVKPNPTVCANCPFTEVCEASEASVVKV